MWKQYISVAIVTIFFYTCSTTGIAQFRWKSGTDAMAGSLVAGRAGMRGRMCRKGSAQSRLSHVGHAQGQDILMVKVLWATWGRALWAQVWSRRLCWHLFIEVTGRGAATGYKGGALVFEKLWRSFRQSQSWGASKRRLTVIGEKGVSHQCLGGQ